METDAVSKTMCFPHLEFQMINKVHTPSDSEHHTPSPEPFRFYRMADVQFLAGMRDFSLFYRIQTGSGAHMSFYPSGTMANFP
jgi:hypothetical protein